MKQMFYTSEEHFRILIALLKAHNIRRIIISPGMTNVTFVGSVQNDPYFELYSEIDERSAGYMACGMAEQSGQPVVLSCTGATASRNYIPALTEAYYRHLPVLAVTSSQHFGRIGNYIAQVTDRKPPEDCAKFSLNISMLHTDSDKWACAVKMNEAILALTHNGGGPVHLNIATSYSSDFSVRELPDVKVIRRIDYDSENMPEIHAKTVGIFIGSHVKCSHELTALIEAFCEKYNGAVICSNTSGYSGKYRITTYLAGMSPRKNMALLIHIGNISESMSVKPEEVWRVNPDGKVRDTFQKLRYVFQMTEEEFFSRYVNLRGGGVQRNTEYYSAWRNDYDYAASLVPELPFSNLWIAQNTIPKLPSGSVLHLGILNSMRSWNYFEYPHNDIYAYCNTGGFGIDGCLSSLAGASIASPEKLFFGVIGDLAFYYDINALGNRNIGKNLRLMMVNNGRGQEFRIYHSFAGSNFGENTDPFMAAAGHFARDNRDFLRHYAEDLGFEYLSASNKEEYLAHLEHFTTPEILDRPIFFEVFTDTKDESDALAEILGIEALKLLPAPERRKRLIKRAVKKLLGKKLTKLVKQIRGRR